MATSARHLASKTVDALKAPKAGRDVIRDTHTRGLWLRITSAGTKSWWIRYRVKGEAQMDTRGRSIQRHHVIEGATGKTLSAARQRAAEIIAAGRRGIDLIAEERRTAEVAARADAERLAAEAKSRTVRQLAEEYVAKVAKPHQRRWKDAERRLKNHVEPHIGDKAVRDLTRADIAGLLDELDAKGLRQMVNRVRTDLSSLFRYGIEQGYLDQSPVVGTRVRKVEVERERVLSDAELKAMWKALADMPEPGRSFAKMLILTATRRDEARAMCWAEVDLNKALWTLPKERDKSQRGRDIPLSAQAVAILEDITRTGPCVFTVSPDGKHPWSSIDWFKKEWDAKSGVTDWRLHDVRRTVRTRLADDLHIPYEVAERILGHSLGKLARIYDRGRYLQPMSDALQAWADRLMLIVGEKGGSNVEVLRATA